MSNINLLELKRLVDAAENMPMVDDKDCKRFFPPEHKGADIMIGPFAIYDTRRQPKGEL